MQLPHDLRLVLERELRQYDTRSLARVTAEISAHYRDPKAGPRPRGPLAAAAYAAARLPATFAACAAVMRVLASQLPDFTPRTLLDAGAGLGAALWAATTIWPTLTRATLIEPDRDMTALGRRLAVGSSIPVIREATWFYADLTGPWDAPRHDLVTAAYVLGEVPEATRATIIARLWDCAEGALLLIEPGTPQGWAVIRFARETLRAVGAVIIAPCPHQNPCPLPADDWCHFAQRLTRERLQRLVKGAELGYEDEKFSYVAVARRPGSPIGARVIRHPVVRPGRIELTLCARDGLDRRTIARSAGAAWRIARDLRWGDAIPLELLRND